MRSYLIIAFAIFNEIGCATSNLNIERSRNRICWGGPESQYSNIEEFSDYLNLIYNRPFTNYENMRKKLALDESNKLYTPGKHYLTYEIKEQEIIVHLYYTDTELLSIETYYYANSQIKKIKKEMLGFKIEADFSLDSNGKWIEIKKIFNSNNQMIYHIQYEITSFEQRMETVIYEDKENYEIKFKKNFFAEFYKKYYEHGAYINCLQPEKMN